MPRDNPDLAFLWDMLDAAKAIQGFVKEKSYDDYEKDRMLRGAVERHIEIIGEAARKVSQQCRDSHPEIPWNKIIAQRNVLIHEYGEIENALLWRVAEIHIPDLAHKLEMLLS